MTDQINYLVNEEFQLQKFPGKGGWTYALIPDISPNKSNPFGWVTVNGSIDDYELKKYKLMPYGNGQLFLPVKAEIRKKIKKQEGDFVFVKLYIDETPLEIPDELMECFKNEPAKVYENFMAFSESEQKAYLDWIYSAKNEDAKAERILKMMDRLLLNKKLLG